MEFDRPKTEINWYKKFGEYPTADICEFLEVLWYDGWDNGYEEGHSSGFEAGYCDGYEEGRNESSD